MTVTVTVPVKRLVAALVVGGAALSLLSACESDAHRVSDNLSTEAEQFRVPREVVFYNAITDKYIADVKGYCSVDSQSGLPGGTIAVTCAVGPDKYVKDYLGKSDNVTWFMLQSSPTDVSRYHYEIVLKPENVVPGLQVEGGQQ